MSTFSPTNTSPLLVTMLGWPFRVAGYAKQAILNGSSTQYAYLGQYFQGAYTMDTNGIATTNQAGLLSEYGEFFPTQAGAAALVTTNNWGTTDHGTGVVQVVALCTDANRDGVIDPGYYGPDYTSPHRPFRFWINDSQDSGDDGGDGIPGLTGSSANGQDNHVNGTRDLVNFFPVSLEIRSLLQAYPSNTFTCWLKHADSALNFASPDYIELPIYATNCLAYLTDTNLAHAIAPTTLPPGAPTYNITPDGVMLSQGFVEGIREGSGSVLLVEAKTNTSSPLVLEIRRGTNVVAQAWLYVSISGVEQMFRHKNLIAETFPNTNSLGGPPDRLNDGDVPNEPDTNDKNFVFLHGYSVSPDQARGVFADVFKRLFWSGSHARFYGVTWKGNESEGNIPLPGGVTLNLPTGVSPIYHTNVANAFLTAPQLALFLATLTNGPTTLAAHSLGNMVALSAISDYFASVQNYFMIDAAVAMEAIDSSVAPDNNMVLSDWQDYTNTLYAATWHSLFASTDPRSTLAWSQRLTNFNSTQVYNFYSSGEEVLRDYPADPPTDVLSALASVVMDALVLQNPPSSYVWVWQEKAKGLAATDSLLGSTHGGWRFNTNYSSLTPAQAALLSPAQLRTNAFFDFASPSFTADLALYGDLGNVYAYYNRNRILSDAIPALSQPVGANSVPRLSQQGQPTRNFNMNSDDFKNGWPTSRTSEEGQRWHHSDFRQVAYTYTYKLFNSFANQGNLK